jgi:hypothetical protein
VVTQSEANRSLVCVAVAVVIVAGFRREAGTTRPTNGIGGRGACDGARESVYVPLCIAVVQVECEGVMAMAISKNRRECTVKCRLSSGRGCWTSVERGPAQAVCQAQILNAKDLGSSSRRRRDDTTCTTLNHTFDDT